MGRLAFPKLRQQITKVRDLFSGGKVDMVHLDNAPYSECFFHNLNQTCGGGDM